MGEWGIIFIHSFIHSFLLNHEKDDILFWLVLKLEISYYRVIIIPPPKDFWFLFGGFSFEDYNFCMVNKVFS